MREIDEFPDDESHPEDRRTKVKDYEEHSLTTEERDEIIRKYNNEHSISRKTPDEIEKTKQSEKSVTDSEDSVGVREDVNLSSGKKNIEPTEDRDRLLGDELLNETNYKELVKDRNPRLYSDEFLSWEEIAKKFGCNTNPFCVDNVKSHRTDDEIFKSIWNEIDLEEVRKLYIEDGLSLKKIGEKYGFKTGDPIKRILEVAGIEIRSVGNQKIEIDPKEVYKLYFEEKRNLDEVAEIMGFKSKSPIRRIFREQGWETRPNSTPKLEIDLNEVHRLYYEEKMTQLEIAEYFGYKSNKPILDVMRKMEWVARPYTTPRKEIDPNEVCRLYYEKNLTLLEVAKHFGYKSRSPIERILKLQGLEPKPPPNAPRIEINPDELYNLYFEEELSLRKVSDYFGCKSTGPIERTIREQGWSLKPIESLDVKQLRDELFGKECVICNSEREIIHKKDGQRHSGSLLWTISGLKSLKRDEWVALCRNCHEIAHALMRSYNIHWNKIEDLLRSINHEYSN